MDAAGETAANQGDDKSPIANNAPTRSRSPSASNTDADEEDRRHQDKDDSEDNADEEEDENEGGDEDEEDESDEEDEEPRLKYAYLTKHLKSVYRNGDATSTFLVAGDKMVKWFLLWGLHRLG